MGVNSKYLGAFVAVENPYENIKMIYLILIIKQKKEKVMYLCCCNTSVVFLCHF